MSRVLSLIRKGGGSFSARSSGKGARTRDGPLNEWERQMAMTISMKRDALLERLSEQLRLAKAEDARVAAHHEKDEQAALKQFRDRLRSILKMDYKATKKETGYGLSMKSPACPRLKATEIQQVINMVNMDTRKSAFRITEGSDLHRAITWTPDSKKLAQTVCD